MQPFGVIPADREERVSAQDPERRAGLHRDRHQFGVSVLEEQLSTAVRPERLAASRGRNLPFGRADIGEGTHIHFVLSRFVGDIGKPMPIRRERGGVLLEFGGDQRDRSAVDPGPQTVDVAAAAHAHAQDEPPSVAGAKPFVDSPGHLRQNVAEPLPSAGRSSSPLPPVISEI